jgi:ABC-type antimicrobial peptide transport system permease subunit
MRSQLVGQFLCESVLMTFLAFIVSIALVQLSLQLFNELADKKMSFPWSNFTFWLLASGFILVTGIIAGSYPAFYLSGFNPVQVLKGTFHAGRSASLPRKVLVTVQFTVSIILIIGTIIVFRQIQYARNRPVGYNREGLLTIETLTQNIHNHYTAVRNDLLNTGVVAEMAESSSPATDLNNEQSNFEWKGKEPNKTVAFGTVGISHEFGKTVGWQIKEGRDFSREYGSDAMGFVINEAARKAMGLKNPIGETVRWMGYNFTIIGVVKDMVMKSPYDPVNPTIFFLAPWWINVVNIKMKPGVGINDALIKIEEVFKKYNPDEPFDYKFVDEEYAKKFSDEKRLGRLATVFAILAIFISSLGLFGLASFVAEQRTKEIGVRKVLGASVFNLWKLLSKDFVSLVIISLLIAAPTAYYFMYNWLQSYQYRTDISWWIFAAAGVGALLITLLTVSFQAIKAAIANPVKSLRTE